MAPARISHARAVRALDALAHDTRLKVHRLLVQAGQDGLSAGFIARKLGLPASSLSFHLMHLQTAELVTQRRAGRSLIYAVDFAVMDGLMAYLQENCCRGFAGDGCDADACAGEERKFEGTSS
ncbi:MAG TPA: metalloregulator ArsR/SmtB family transcription factor [Candidatus Angelobacter sp.]|nr:metalloregulator ArsR/SmtB family transcription factor [Candidatus Angelobacter sp.]